MDNKINDLYDLLDELYKIKAFNRILQIYLQNYIEEHLCISNSACIHNEIEKLTSCAADKLDEYLTQMAYETINSRRSIS